MKLLVKAIGACLFIYMLIASAISNTNGFDNLSACENKSQVTLQNQMSFYENRNNDGDIESLPLIVLPAGKYKSVGQDKDGIYYKSVDGWVSFIEHNKVKEFRQSSKERKNIILNSLDRKGGIFIPKKGSNKKTSIFWLTGEMTMPPSESSSGRMLAIAMAIKMKNEINYIPLPTYLVNTIEVKKS